MFNQINKRKIKEKRNLVGFRTKSFSEKLKKASGMGPYAAYGYATHVYYQAQKNKHQPVYVDAAVRFVNRGLVYPIKKFSSYDLDVISAALAMSKGPEMFNQEKEMIGNELNHIIKKTGIDLTSIIVGISESEMFIGAYLPLNTWSEWFREKANNFVDWVFGEKRENLNDKLDTNVNYRGHWKPSVKESEIKLEKEPNSGKEPDQEDLEKILKDLEEKYGIKQTKNWFIKTGDENVEADSKSKSESDDEKKTD